MTVLMAECAGLWRRTLLIEADGTRDARPGVLWLQGLTAYVDSRGFAGTLEQDGDVFRWHRAVDTQPPGPFPDAGLMSTQGEILVETGVHEDYVEHWVRDPGPVSPTGALFLVGGGAQALLVRAGGLFGWADGVRTVIGARDDADYQKLEITLSGNVIRANGVRWTVQKSEGNVDL